MTQEDKQLLLKDLCARLPYGVKVQAVSVYGYTVQVLIDGYCSSNNKFDIDLRWRTLDEFKPYLRPMSSMTEEEKMRLKEEHLKDARLFAEALTKAAEGDNSMRGKVIPHFAADWCNKNHFDFHGLIPMGLALEAPEGMYKTE